MLIKMAVVQRMSAVFCINLPKNTVLYIYNNSISKSYIYMTLKYCTITVFKEIKSRFVVFII